MTITVSFNEAKRNLSKMLDDAENGDRIIVAKHGRPVAIIVSAKSEHVNAAARSGRLRPVLIKRKGRASLKLLQEDRGDSHAVIKQRPVA